MQNIESELNGKLVLEQCELNLAVLFVSEIIEDTRDVILLQARTDVRINCKSRKHKTYNVS